MKIGDLCKNNKRAILLLAISVIWNQIVYTGGNLIARSFHHYNMELGIDGYIPFIPWTVCIYIFSYLFWIITYIICARRNKALAYRFFCADFLAKGVCLALFLFLPTTNIRPAVEGSTFWHTLMRFIYWIDNPTNLFPSIHCLASWLCFIGMRKDTSMPLWYRCFSGAAAIAICCSTVTTKQHVIVDIAGGVLLAELCYWVAGRVFISARYSRLIDRLLKE